jgi:uncharacterized protein
LTVTISATFIASLGLAMFTIATIGLLVGGLLAAPLGALLTKKARPQVLLSFVGCALAITSVYGALHALS